jgi:hypothetical protein
MYARARLIAEMVKERSQEARRSWLGRGCCSRERASQLEHSEHKARAVPSFLPVQLGMAGKERMREIHRQKPLPEKPHVFFSRADNR